jgi:hypothetical protein
LGEVVGHQVGGESEGVRGGQQVHGAERVPREQDRQVRSNSAFRTGLHL